MTCYSAMIAGRPSVRSATPETLKDCQVKHKIPCEESPIYKKNQESGGAEEEARGARACTGGGPRRDAENCENEVGIPLRGAKASSRNKEAEVFLAQRSRMTGRGLWGTTITRTRSRRSLLFKRGGNFSLAAPPFCRCTLEGRERILGSDHPDTLENLRVPTGREGNLMMDDEGAGVCF